ncbi:MAG TPA: hypothetical protein VF941_04840 [Clostridia bacterium]
MKFGTLDIKKIENDKYIVKNSKLNNYIKMGHEELEFLKRIKEYEKSKLDFNSECFTYKDFTKEEIAYLIDRFIEWGFIDSEWFKQDNISNSPKFEKKNKSTCRFDISAIHIVSFNPQKILLSLKSYTEILFSKYAIAVYTITLITSFFMVKANKHWFVSITLKDFSIKDFIILIMMFTITIFIHEFSHAVSCSHFGGEVQKMGVMLFYLAPAFYCDLSDIYFFEKKRYKIFVSAAGIISQSFLFASSIILYSILKIFNVDYKILILYAILNLLSCVGNLIPFVKLDGYWMLSGFLDITNLREKSLKCIISLLNIVNLGDTKELHRNEKLIFLSYGLFSIIFSALFWAASLYAINSYVSLVFNNIVKNITVLTIVLSLVIRLGIAFSRLLRN